MPHTPPLLAVQFFGKYQAATAAAASNSTKAISTASRATMAAGKQALTGAGFGGSASSTLVLATPRVLPATNTFVGYIFPAAARQIMH